MQYSYKTKGTCSSAISFDIDEEGKLKNVVFTGGCNGNLKAVSKLVDGMSVDQIYGLLAGNTCGNKPTSCADQLAQALVHARNSARG